jgi:hypothetical protein
MMKITPNMKSELEQIQDGWKLRRSKDSKSPWFRTAKQGYSVQINTRTGDKLLASGLVSSEDGRDYELTEVALRLLSGQREETPTAPRL